MTFTLKSCPKLTGKAFDKVLSPAETILKAKKILENHPEILLETKRIDKGRLGIPVYISLYGTQGSKITGTFKQMGKGITPEQAEASAIMELVERFSLFTFIKQSNFVKHTINDLPNHLPLEELFKAIHFNASVRDFDNLSTLLNLIPLSYVHALDFTRKKPCYLPWYWFLNINEYNGSAAGNTLEEAAFQGLMEVVERHACALTTHGHRPTLIDEKTITDPDCVDLLIRFDKIGIKKYILNLSSDLGIPTVGFIAYDPSTYPTRSEIVYAAGTASSPARALIRAITECAQLAGDFDTDGKYLESGLPKFDDLTKLNEFLGSLSTSSFTDLPELSNDDFLQEIETACNILKKHGLNTYFVDITNNNIGLPCVYVIIPGNHFRDRAPNHPASVLSKLLSTYEYTENSVDYLQMIKKLYPERWEVSANLACCLEKRGNYQDALKHHDEALHLCDDHESKAEIYLHKAFCLKEMEDYRGSIDLLERALEINPFLTDAYSLLGLIYHKTNDYLKSIEYFEKSLDLNPQNPLDMANIAKNFQSMGLFQLARKWYELSLKLNPDITWAREELEKLEEIQ